MHVVLQHYSAQLTFFVLSQSMCYGGMRAQITGQQEDTVPMKMPESQQLVRHDEYRELTCVTCMDTEKNITFHRNTVLIKHAFNFSAQQCQVLGVSAKYASHSSAMLTAEVTFS